MTEEHHDRADWIFVNRYGANDPGSLILDSRKLICLDADGSVAWTRTFKTRAQARASFEGDLRAMRKNDCYRWVQA